MCCGGDVFVGIKYVASAEERVLGISKNKLTVVFKKSVFVKAVFENNYNSGVVACCALFLGIGVPETGTVRALYNGISVKNILVYMPNDNAAFFLVFTDFFSFAVFIRHISLSVKTDAEARKLTVF